MAGYQALAAAGASIVALLNRRFAEHPEAAALQTFLASSNELKTMKTNTGQIITEPAISVYCYRVSVDKETRPGWSGVNDGIPHIPLRMHLLIAAWAANASDELQWLGLAAEVLESDSILTGVQLLPLPQPAPFPDANPWQPGDAVQVVTDDLALESMSEAFQALTTEFRLTLPYIARVICLDGPQQPVRERVTVVADQLNPLRGVGT